MLFHRRSNRAVDAAERLGTGAGNAHGAAELQAKLRLLRARGLRRRWRQVVIRRTDNGGLLATPYRPRVAASFDLSETRATGRRDARRAERWWFSGPTVLLADGDLGPIELGFGTVSEFAVAARVFGRADLAERVGTRRPREAETRATDQ